MAVNQVDGVVDLIEALGYEWAHFEGESMGANDRHEIRAASTQSTRARCILNGFGMRQHRSPDDGLQRPPRASDAGSLRPLSVAAVTDPSYDNVGEAAATGSSRSPTRDHARDGAATAAALPATPTSTARCASVFGVGQPATATSRRCSLTRNRVRGRATAGSPRRSCIWGEPQPRAGPRVRRLLRGHHRRQVLRIRRRRPLAAVGEAR